MSVSASWSGSYPCLCSGEWTLIVNGKDVSDLIPKELRKHSMNTFGKYQSSHFENWSEVFDDYTEGLHCEEWIKENSYWLNLITEDIDTQKLIFLEIQKNDWRSGSCGGCI